MNSQFWNLLQVEKAINLEFSSRDWKLLESYLIDNRLQALVYHSVGSRLPEVLRNSFSLQWKSQWFRNQLYFEELKEIQRRGLAESLQIVALKGAAIIPKLYPDFGSRQMSDLDLFVSREQMDPVKKCLAELGYEERPELKWKANNFKSVFLKTRNGFELTIELHTSLFATEPRDFQWQFERENPLQLSVTDQLVHLLGHYSYQHSFLKLFWLVDIDRWIRKYRTQLDWQRFEMLTKLLRIRKAASATLWVSQAFLGTPVPSQVSASRSSMQKLFLTESFLWKKKFGLSYYLLKQDLKDSWLESLTYNCGWISQKIRQRM